MLVYLFPHPPPMQTRDWSVGVASTSLVVRHICHSETLQLRQPVGVGVLLPTRALRLVYGSSRCQLNISCSRPLGGPGTTSQMASSAGGTHGTLWPSKTSASSLNHVGEVKYGALSLKINTSVVLNETGYRPPPPRGSALRAVF